MNKILFACFLMLTINTQIALDNEFTFEDDVLILNDNNIDLALNQFKFILIEFYAHWCAHCKQFAPEYSQIAREAKEQKLGAQVAKIDCDKNRLSQQRFGIQSYPTIKIFIDGHPLEFEKTRNAQNVMEFIKETTGESLDELPTLDEVKEFLDEFPTAVILFVESVYDKSLKVFNIVSKIYQDLAFGYTNSAEAREYYNVRKNSIILFKDFDELRNDFRGKVLQNDLQKFINENTTPIFSEFNEQAEERIFKRQRSALLYIYNENEQSQQQKKTILSIAPLIKKRIQVVGVNINDGYLTSILDRLNTRSVSPPELFYYRWAEGKGQPFRFKESFSLDNIMRFVHYADIGKIERSFRSLEPPVQNGSLLQVVGETFDKLVYQSGKDILLQFTTSYSQERFQKFQGTYVELAEKISSVNKNIVLAQVDAVANELSNFRIQQFPTFKLFRAKVPYLPLDLPYNATPKAQTLVDFLKNHTSFAWVDVKLEEEEAEVEVVEPKSTDL